MHTLSRSERLDRLSYNREHTRLLVGSGIGWALDAMDVGLISFVMAALALQWDLDNTTLSVIGSIGFVGMALGSSLGGLLADKVGRRNVFALSLLIYGAATGASALVTSVLALIVLRFIVGLGLGAELPVASTLVSEFAPARIRGRLVVVLEAFWALGWIMAALIGYFVIPLSDQGWRWALAVGIVPTLYGAYVRWGLPESVRFLESKGRYEEAERAVVTFESAGAVKPSSLAQSGLTRKRRGETLDAPCASSSQVLPPERASEVVQPEEEAKENSSVWSPKYRKRTAALWVVWFGINFSYYGAFIWLPTLLSGELQSLSKSFLYTLLITLAQIPGYAAAAYLIETWGRRATLVTFLVGSAGGAGLFALVASHTIYWGDSQGVLLVLSGSLLSFFNLGAWGALYAVSPEQYPTRIRGKGTGAAAAFGRIASILAPLSVPVLLGVGGIGLVFTVLGVSFLVAAGAAWTMKETLGVPLED